MWHVWGTRIRPTSVGRIELNCADSKRKKIITLEAGKKNRDRGGGNSFTPRDTVSGKRDVATIDEILHQNPGSPVFLYEDEIRTFVVIFEGKEQFTKNQ